MIIRVRRGLESNRHLFIPALGEPVFTTDTKRLYVGDGVTPGGIPVDIGGGEGGEGVDIIHRADKDNPHEVTKAQVGLGNVPDTDFTSAVAANTAKRSYPTADQNKLAGIEAGATANSSDADLRDRLTHTGTQPISSVTGLQSALDSKQVAGDYATSSDVSTSLNSKVDKVSGKQLSTEDYTTTEKTKLANATTGTALSADNTLPRFDGTDGKTLQSSGVLVSDDDDISTTGFIESTLIIGSPSVAVDEIVEYYEGGGVLIDDVLVKDGLVSGRDVALDGYKLDSVEPGAEVNTVTSVNGQTGDVLVTGEGGTTDHGLLDGLGDDDHPQYHTDARGDARYYRKSEVDAQLEGKSPTSHNHDDRYYTEAETNSLLSGKADASHTHPATDLTATGRTTSNFLRGDNTWATPTNTTYAVPTQSEAEAGTATTARAFSAQRVNQAIQSLAPVKQSDLDSKVDKSGGTITGSLDVAEDIYSNGSKVLAGSKSGAANNWTVYDYGAWKEYTKRVVLGSVSLPAGGSAYYSIGALPVPYSADMTVSATLGSTVAGTNSNTGSSAITGAYKVHIATGNNTASIVMTNAYNSTVGMGTLWADLRIVG